MVPHCTKDPVSDYWTNGDGQVKTENSLVISRTTMITKKQLSKARGYKKAVIASMHKLIRTIYALIINDQPWIRLP